MHQKGLFVKYTTFNIDRKEKLVIKQKICEIVINDVTVKSYVICVNNASWMEET